MRKMILLIGLLALTVCQQNTTVPLTREKAMELRKKMIEQQIMARGVKNPLVIEAMRTVPRHEFVPRDIRSNAYNDQALPIGFGQTISQPYIVAFMSEHLGVKPGDRVLEIGTGSGYQAAVLARIVDTVYTMEIIPQLAERAARTLQHLGYKNVVVRHGDGYAGWPEKAPFDAIIVTAAPPSIPPPLLAQLKTGGRMVLPVGEYVQELNIIRKTESGLHMESVLPVRFVPMTGKIQQKNKQD